MAFPETPGVVDTTSRLRELLSRARQIKPGTDIEPPIPATEFQGEKGIPLPEDVPRNQAFAAVEYAARQIYQETAACVAITSPEFVEIWNLFDILNVCGDQEQCDVALVWWLIEELLETQSLDNCRIVFDYLESRRETLVAQHFEKKQLVVLRAFNELLRRLSRAEDSVFCGRVFVFLFQSFPLGDRSSVNLKGEFHKENLTTFEGESRGAVPLAEMSEAMTGVEYSSDAHSEKGQSSPNMLLSTESGLYPAFWAMQQAFSNPPEYFFEMHRMDEFKTTLEATLAKFKHTPKVNQAVAEERKMATRNDDDAADFSSTFNPKYLTSRELFTLELSDLAFQRHILVQALILLDFLLSLTEGMKKRQAGFPNKSLQFEFTLNSEDASWAERMRSAISTYLSDGQLGGHAEGKLYHRMVETVLSRDKNWVRWKLGWCKEIKRKAVDTNELSAAQTSITRMSKPAALKSAPMGALNLEFLDVPAKSAGSGAAEITRSKIPVPETLVKDVEAADLDLDMAMTDEERQILQDAKMSKTWRSLRFLSKTHLNLFEKADDGRNLGCFTQSHGTAVRTIEGGENLANGGDEGTTNGR